ncbi:MAG: hypothetical protein HY537_01630 [Deltaproteobacteria bacterium]|nr:hypothetical protein [Deltaproteobacteria bacterium]
MKRYNEGVHTQNILSGFLFLFFVFLLLPNECFAPVGVIGDYYQFLGVPSGASDARIKVVCKARIEEARRRGDRGLQEKLELVESVLGDPDSRREYDERRSRPPAQNFLEEMQSMRVELMHTYGLHLKDSQKEKLLRMRYGERKIELERIKGLDPAPLRQRSAQESRQHAIMRKILASHVYQFIAGNPTEQEIIDYLEGLHGILKVAEALPTYFGENEPDITKARLRMGEYLRDRKFSNEHVYLYFFVDWISAALKKHPSIAPEEVRAWYDRFQSQYGRSPSSVARETLKALPMHSQREPYLLFFAETLPPAEALELVKGALEDEFSERQAKTAKETREFQEKFPSFFTKYEGALTKIYGRDPALHKQMKKYGGLRGWWQSVSGSESPCARFLRETSRRLSQ